MFRTIGDQPSLWESLLPEEVLRLPGELSRVDVLLDDPAFFAPFAPHAATTAGHFPTLAELPSEVSGSHPVRPGATTSRTGQGAGFPARRPGWDPSETARPPPAVRPGVPSHPGCGAQTGQDPLPWESRTSHSVACDDQRRF